MSAVDEPAVHLKGRVSQLIEPTEIGDYRLGEALTRRADGSTVMVVNRSPRSRLQKVAEFLKSGSGGHPAHETPALVVGGDVDIEEGAEIEAEVVAIGDPMTGEIIPNAYAAVPEEVSVS